MERTPARWSPRATCCCSAAAATSASTTCSPGGATTRCGARPAACAWRAARSCSTSPCCAPRTWRCSCDRRRALRAGERVRRRARQEGAHAQRRAPGDRLPQARARHPALPAGARGADVADPRDLLGVPAHPVRAGDRPGVTILEDGPELRGTVATACRILERHGLVEGILGHVSARVSASELRSRCRGGARGGGLRFSDASDVWRLTLDGEPVDVPEGHDPPKELPIHTETLRGRPDFGAVVHAHPPAALLAGLAGLRPRPVFGAYNMPAMRLAMQGVPVYERSVLITRAELAAEMLAAMGDSDVVVLQGHGITVGAPTVEQATVLAVNLNVLLDVTVKLRLLGAQPPDVGAEDLAELPDLGSAFNDQLVWQALVAEL